MTEQYYLIDPWNRTETEAIGPKQAKELISARKYLTDYISFEENISAVKNAAHEYEEFLLKVGLDYEFKGNADHDYFQDTRVLANGKVLSVLNSITSFRDRFPNIELIKNGHSALEIFKENWRLQKQHSLPFHFCEVLRNYAQHNTQPISGVTVGGGWDDERQWRESHASIFVTVAEVTSDRKVSPENRREFLDYFGTKADVSLVLREGVDGLGKVAKEMRNWLGGEFERMSSLYQSYLDKAQRDGFLYLTLSMDPVNTQGQPQFFPDFLARAKNLRGRQILTHTSNHYVSSRARGHTTK